ncbi:hypothetical protein VCR26J2_40202 [Vibrio coralliirubri]|nr:hypothetical protein VCR4J2_560038 [Vibrio coralliirubri]CDT83972.1 hypothetical protein VCR26J2_40202 [Vibrio coralliirubri]
MLRSLLAQGHLAASAVAISSHETLSLENEFRGLGKVCFL